jgi:hypothetical protein
VTIKNAVFWDVTPCGSFKTRISSKTSFLQEPHGVTCQKTSFFNNCSYNNILSTLSLSIYRDRQTDKERERTCVFSVPFSATQTVCGHKGCRSHMVASDHFGSHHPTFSSGATEGVGDKCQEVWTVRQHQEAGRLLQRYSGRSSHIVTLMLGKNCASSIFRWSTESNAYLSARERVA